MVQVELCQFFVGHLPGERHILRARLGRLSSVCICERPASGDRELEFRSPRDRADQDGYAFIRTQLTHEQDPKRVRSQIKAWCTRRLKTVERLRFPGMDNIRENWWAERGSIRWIFQESDLAAAIEYVLDQQDNPRRFVK